MRNRLRPEVRLKLFQTAVAFYRFLEVPRLLVRDIILTGSNAGYNYTSLSDIDIHLLIKFSGTPCPDLTTNIFTTKKTLWSKTYNTKVRGHAVELYVEDTDSPVTATGIYSILHGKWIKFPKHETPSPDDTAIEYKFNAFAAEIDSLLDGVPAIIDLNQMLGKIYTLRQNGLLTGGEFSTENLTFKMLRTFGYLDRLRDKRVEVRDTELSLS